MTSDPTNICGAPINIFFSIIKNYKSTFEVILKTIKTKKIRFLLEETYQNFSFELKTKLSK